MLRRQPAGDAARARSANCSQDQVFPVGGSWVRALFGSVRSPGSNPVAPIFPCKSASFQAPICGVLVTQKLNGTYHAEVRGSQKCCKSCRSTAIVGTTGRIGEVHGSRTGPLARKDLLIRMFTAVVRRPSPVLCPSVPKTSRAWPGAPTPGLMVPSMIPSRSLAPAFRSGAALAVDRVESSAGVPGR